MATLRKQHTLKQFNFAPQGTRTGTKTKFKVSRRNKKIRVKINEIQERKTVGKKPTKLTPVFLNV